MKRMGPKRKRFDSLNTVSYQLDPTSREKVEKIFQKKFSYSNFSNHDIQQILRIPLANKDPVPHGSESKKDNSNFGSDYEKPKPQVTTYAQKVKTGAPKRETTESDNSKDFHDNEQSRREITHSNSNKTTGSSKPHSGCSTENQSDDDMIDEQNNGSRETENFPGINDADANKLPGVQEESQQESQQEHQWERQQEHQQEHQQQHQQQHQWQDEDLQKLKKSLNDLKDQLSDKDVIEWHKHTCFTNYAGSVVGELKQDFRVELCTQAWSKFFEVASSYPIVPLCEDVIGSVHLCEAPGAFITALNHYIISHGFSGQWSWVGTSLCPYYEGNNLVQMIDDDRFIRSTLDNWYFGEDGTGDIMDLHNLQGLVDRTHSMGAVHLVTADGSIDCQNTPAEQEVVVSPLHYCEVLTALHILAPGGALVIKLFTMFESSTVCLMFLLCSQFEQVNVFKPATSKSGNSEVYVVCLNYRKHLNPGTLSALNTHFFASNSADTPLFRKYDLPPGFLREHVQCCQYFVKLQSDTIQGNLEMYRNISEQQRCRLELMREYCSEVFVNSYKLKTIPGYLKITHYSHKKAVSKFSASLSPSAGSNVKNKLQQDKLICQRVHSGSFRCRQEHDLLPWKQKLPLMEKCDVNLSERINLVCHDSLHPCEILDWRVIKGRPLQHIQSSRFCEGEFVKKLNAVWKHVQLDEFKKAQKQSYEDELTGVLSGLFSHLGVNESHQLIKVDAHPGLTEVIEKCVNAKHETNFNDIHISEFEPKAAVLSIVDPNLPPGTEELQVRADFLSKLIHILKILPEGGHLVLHLYTSLTFFTTDLIYIISRLFSKGGMCHHLGGVWLQQVVYFSSVGDVHPSVLSYLQEVEQEMRVSSPQQCPILELLPKEVIIDDSAFRRFIVSMNRGVVGHFVNSVIDEELSKLEKQQMDSNVT